MKLRRCESSLTYISVLATANTDTTLLQDIQTTKRTRVDAPSLGFNLHVDCHQGERRRGSGSGMDVDMEAGAYQSYQSSPSSSIAIPIISQRRQSTSSISPSHYFYPGMNSALSPPHQHTHEYTDRMVPMNSPTESSFHPPGLKPSSFPSVSPTTFFGHITRRLMLHRHELADSHAQVDKDHLPVSTSHARKFSDDDVKLVEQYGNGLEWFYGS